MLTAYLHLAARFSGGHPQVDTGSLARWWNRRLSGCMIIHPNQPVESWFPLDPSEPFTRREARAAGLTDRNLREMIDLGLLRRPLRGVFLDHRQPDDLGTRVKVLAKVVPPGAFVADRTAGWLHGAEMILAPNDHLAVPKVSVFHLPGADRTRLALADSGERRMRPDDLCEVGGILVTTPLRTALDLGRLLRRQQALAGLDSMLRRGGFSHDMLLASVERFAKQRGVRQLRELAPLADGQSASPGESGLRLHWLDAGLPRPTLQIPHIEDGVTLFFLDMGLEELRFAAEYDGVAWHSSSEDVEHDRARRDYLRTNFGWRIDEFRKEHVYGRDQNADWILRDAIVEARRTFDHRIRFL
ncbi:hypothetical protein ncot_12530 [Nocardioides sp. JQ2195]|uniref:type IV toxin-antitoxin system AbiEi family antitoxin domain-containing protein n=1 Tax=Nocardioides sp. JQ2195 TaxID=2592334 RepID=UPI00143E34A1|nr:type IV toxin-antitoxin system AbiEi family antitoxin domain-containing protein [Nocardioides sp. JQ2195]QIX27335.1 hypothetical protein ncot_12530 [Nocardioides sp. JQ2195]